ncbi:MAG: hypothetical protein RL141_365, partial [Candidatus Parcubacteria bacterium]
PMPRLFSKQERNIDVSVSFPYDPHTNPEGLLAQLVERFHGMEEVKGSTPLESTIKNSLQMQGVFYEMP